MCPQHLFMWAANLLTLLCQYVQSGPEKIAQSLMQVILQPFAVESHGFCQHAQKR